MSKRITIVGSGLIGQSWACVFARGHHNVTMWDAQEKQREQAPAGIRRRCELLADAGLLPENDTVDSMLARVRMVHTLEEALANAEYVQECAPESLEVKRAVFLQLSALAPATAVLASSTSMIVPSTFTEAVHHRERCLVAHPVNPPHLCPVVELVPAPWTSNSTVEAAAALHRGCGMVPAVLKRETPGFLVNRLQHALLAEAFRLVTDGVADAADIDACISEGLGLRWSFLGPLGVIDLNAPGGTADYMQRYGPGMKELVRGQDNQREDLFSDETTAAIAAQARAAVPAGDLAARMQWRDRRLLALVAHKKEQARTTDVTYSVSAAAAQAAAPEK